MIPCVGVLGNEPELLRLTLGVRGLHKRLCDSIPTGNAFEDGRVRIIRAIDDVETANQHLTHALTHLLAYVEKVASDEQS